MALFWKSRKSGERIQKAIQRGAAAPARGGIWKFLRGPNADAGVRRGIRQGVRGIIQEQKQDYRYQTRKMDEQSVRDRDRYVRRLDSSLRLSSLKDEYERLKRADHPGAARLEQRVEFTQRHYDRRMREYDQMHEKQLRERRIQHEVDTRKMRREQTEQAYEQLGEAQEQYQEKQARQRAMYEQSNIMQRPPGQELGKGGFRRTNPGPAGSNPRSSYTQPGR